MRDALERESLSREVSHIVYLNFGDAYYYTVSQKSSYL